MVWIITRHHIGGKRYPSEQRLATDEVDSSRYGQQHRDSAVGHHLILSRDAKPHVRIPIAPVGGQSGGNELWPLGQNEVRQIWRPRDDAPNVSPPFIGLFDEKIGPRAREHAARPRPFERRVERGRRSPDDYGGVASISPLFAEHIASRTPRADLMAAAPRVVCRVRPADTCALTHYDSPAGYAQPTRLRTARFASATRQFELMPVDLFTSGLNWATACHRRQP